ncbi:MAG: hypothetical protein ACRENA_07850 [Vulcanimicrobiaceae bacterium]
MTDAFVLLALSLVAGLVSIYGKSSALRAGAFAVLVVGMFVLWYASTGVPRLQYLHVPRGTVLSFRLDEPKAIYLWLVPDGDVRPIALELPWRNDVAGNLADAARERGQSGDVLKMRNGTTGMGLQTKPEFYLSHVVGLPPKPTER